MRSLLAAAVLAVVTLTTLPASAGTSASGTVLTTVTADEVEALLRERGLSPERRKDPAGGPRTVLKLGAWNVSIFYFTCAGPECSSLQLYARFDAASPPHDAKLMNDWNRRHRLSRAYLDTTGQTVLETDLDLSGGVTRERILHWVDVYRQGVEGFARHIGYAK